MPVAFTQGNLAFSTHPWRIRSGDRWRSQPSRNHGILCARSNNDVVVAVSEIFLPRGDARSSNAEGLISAANNCPCSSAKLTPCDIRSTMGSLVSPPIWSRVAACPIGELRERAAELALQASDVGAIADALEPFKHQRHFLAVLPDLFD